MGQRATLRLAATGPVTGARFAGLDRYGRDLARLVIAGQDVAVFEGRNQAVWQVRFGTKIAREGALKHTLRFNARLNHSLTIRRDVEGMTEHPRLTLPGATYYFTVRLQQPGSTLLTDRIDALRWAYAKAVQEFPVTCHAMVVLPDHLHAIWTEPAGELWYAERWQRIKLRFTQAVAEHGPERSAKRDGGLWQRRFRETAIRHADDYGRAMEHCRINPVRHGWVSTPDLWPYSSFTKARGGVAGLAGAGLTGGPVGPAARPLQMSLARIA